jgi:hypothetical protein
MSQEQSPKLGDALRLWQEKLAYLEIQYVQASDPSRKFELDQLIKESGEEIQRLKKDVVIKHETVDSTGMESRKNEPKLIYRQRVYDLLLANNGEITSVGREVLELLRAHLRLRREEAEIIEVEAFQLYEEYKSKLKLYEQSLKEVISRVPFE